MIDQQLQEAMALELKRQQEHIELIASENFVSQDVLDATGSILTNKYAEGYPHKRYYGGCEYVDIVEELAIERLKRLFGAEHANVQPHSGSQANMAVYMSILEPKDRVLGMSLSDGGHLTHGHPLSFSGKLYEFHGYGVDPQTEMIDYAELHRLAIELKPKLIVAGASAYPRTIDFKRFKEIADEVGAYFMVDMAHIAGLVAAGEHPSPVPYADFVTSTTHKTLRGPRGGIILCKKEFAEKIDKTAFPGIQGGPLMHIIAAKAVCFQEALDPSFAAYQKQVRINTQAFAESLKQYGVRLVSGGSDNHMLLVDVKQSFNVTGKEAEAILHKVNITCNKNSIPFDTLKPFVTSGIRLGTPAMTTRGFQEEEFKQVAMFIVEALNAKDDEQQLQILREKVKQLTASFPIYKED